MNPAELSTLCLYAAYSAIGVYVVSFIAFALDLAKRSGDALRVSATRAAAGKLDARLPRGALRAGATRAGATRAGATTGHSLGVAVLERPDSLETDDEAAPSSTFQRVALALLTLGLVLHVASVVLRGVAAARVPWSDMFEFGLTGTALIVGVFLVVTTLVRVGYLGAYITGLTLILLGIAVVDFYVPVGPLIPALQSYWLVVHVFVACLGTAFFAIAGGLSAAQIVQARRASGTGSRVSLFETLPAADRLEDLAYRIALVGFVLWTFTLIAGAVWAEAAWGRYWGWDTKEVWTFIIWVIYAGYIHARATRGWRGTRSSVLSIVGLSAVMFNFSVVNLFFHGMHSYSGITGS